MFDLGKHAPGEGPLLSCSCQSKCTAFHTVLSLQLHITMHREMIKQPPSQRCPLPYSSSAKSAAFGKPHSTRARTCLDAGVIWQPVLPLKVKHVTDVCMPGGRLTTRKTTWKGLQFDHGCQFIRPVSEIFRAICEEWKEAGKQHWFKVVC